MKIPTQRLLKAVAKKRLRGEPSEDRQPPVPKRPRAPVPETSPPPAAGAPEIDLTADTPPERVETEEAATGEPVQEEPAIEEQAEAEPSASGSARSEAAFPEVARDWGEGPSGTPSPPLEEAPARSPPTGPSSAGGAERGRVKPGPPRDSLLNDGHWAERVLAPVFTPEILEELSHLRAGTFFRESYAAVVRIAHSLRAAREVIHGGKALLRETQEEVEEARRRAEAAEEALESARVAFDARVKAAEDRAEMEASRSQVALNQMAEAEDAVTARDAQISELTSVIHEAEGRAFAAEERVRLGDERLKRAEERIGQAEEEAGRAREAEKAALEALAAEEGVRAAKVEAAIVARTAGVIEEYKASERFVDDVAEASAAVFLQGFRHGKEKIARELHFPQALEVEPDLPSDSASDGEPALTDP